MQTLELEKYGTVELTDTEKEVDGGGFLDDLAYALTLNPVGISYRIAKAVFDAPPCF